MVKFGVVVFPGSNCDKDCLWAAGDVMGQKADFIWHESKDINKYDVIILPGGFSYGDYLRSGAIARFRRLAICCANGQTVVRSAPVTTTFSARPQGYRAS